MANYTYYQGGLDAGRVYYAHAQPLQTGLWIVNSIPGTQNGTTGEFDFVVDDGTSYEIYLREGGTPATSDTPVGVIPLLSATAALATTAQLTLTDAEIATRASTTQLNATDNELALKATTVQLTATDVQIALVPKLGGGDTYKQLRDGAGAILQEGRETLTATEQNP